MSRLPSIHPHTASDERGYQRIRVRQDTLENWGKNNPVLESGEFGYVIGATDPGEFLKIGDGTVPWSQLPWLMASGNSGPPGTPGIDGHSMTVYGPSDLPPSLVNNPVARGDIWLSNGLYAKNPSFSAALIQPGAKGDAGEIQSVSAVALKPGAAPTAINAGTKTDAQLVFGIPVGDKGDPGIQGPLGPAGPQGPAGDTFKISGAVANAASLPATPASLAVFIAQDNSHLFIFDPASAAALPSGYVDLGAIAGPRGESAFFSNPVADAASLPSVGAAGQCIVTLDDGHLHSWNPATLSWVDGGSIRGPAGPSGMGDGNAHGQVPKWDAAQALWVSSDIQELPEGTQEGDILTWSVADDRWAIDRHKMGTEDNVFLPADPVSAFGSVPIYDISTDSFEVRKLSIEELSDGPGNIAPLDADVLAWDENLKRWLPTTPPPGNFADLTDVSVSAAVAGDIITADGKGGFEAKTPAKNKLVDLTDVTAKAAVVGDVITADGVGGFQAKAPAKNKLVDLTDVDAKTAIAGDIITADGTGKFVAKTQAKGKLVELTDVDAKTAAVGDIITADGAGRFQSKPPTSYTKAEVDTKVAALVAGISHEESVLDRTDTPPATPSLYDLYIVGATPTGLWAGKANNIAEWDGTAWTFSAPRANETHLVEADSSTYHWNGTAWVKIAVAVSGGSSAQAGVGEIISWIGDNFPATDYLECAGQIVAIASYQDLYSVIGNKYNTGTAADGTTTFALPELRGYFLRGAKAGLTVGTQQQWTTGRPRTSFTTNDPGNHTHGHGTGSQINSDGAPNWVSGFQVGNTDPAGAHTHTITGGGDAETAPDHFVVKWLIRYRAINGGSKGDKGDRGPGVPATAKAGDVLTYDGATSAWVGKVAPSPYPKLVGNKTIEHHVYGSNNWEETVITIANIAAFIPVGHLYKLELDARLLSFHGGNAYLNTWFSGGGLYGNTGARGDQVSVLSTVQTPHSGYSRHITGLSAVALLTLHIASTTTASNGDRQVFGEVLLWDLGPDADIPTLS